MLDKNILKSKLDNIQGIYHTMRIEIHKVAGLDVIIDEKNNRKYAVNPYRLVNVNQKVYLSTYSLLFVLLI